MMVIARRRGVSVHRINNIPFNNGLNPEESALVIIGFECDNTRSYAVRAGLGVCSIVVVFRLSKETNAYSTQDTVLLGGSPHELQ